MKHFRPSTTISRQKYSLYPYILGLASFCPPLWHTLSSPFHLAHLWNAAQIR
jgi:hypothetical protein